MLSHSFFICNREKEPDRYDYLIKQIKLLNMTNVSFFHHIWGDEITDEIREKYCRSDETMRRVGRNMVHAPLRCGEISLYLNYIECMKYIKNKYTSGYFAIFESDAVFNESYNHCIDKLMEKINNINADTSFIVYIGECCGVKKTYTSDIILKRYLCDEDMFAEGVIWSYKAVCRFLDHFEKNQLIDSPIDTKLIFSKEIFEIYATLPYLVSQGSRSGLFKSHLR